MGHSLPRNLIEKGFLPFALLLIVTMSPLVCFGQSKDSTELHNSFSNSEKEILPQKSIASSSETELKSADFKFDFTKDHQNQVVDPPLLAFSVRSLTTNESNDTFAIEVELVEANSSLVEVDIIFVGSSSSATLSDISNYTTKTLRFGPSDPGGTVKSIDVFLNDDREYESSKTAVFKLQNNSAGSIVDPSSLTVTIRDNDTPDVLINEIYINPADRYGDANGDGIVNRSEDEFIEIVNNEDSPVNIGGWTLSSGPGETAYTFPQNSHIPAESGVVVFGGGTPARNFGGAQIFVADKLGLSSSDGAVEFMDDNGNLVSAVSLRSKNGDGQSITRFPDINGSLSTKHSEARGSRGLFFSPGTKVDGTSFGSRFATAIRGSEGWRMLSTPTENTSFKDLLGEFSMQTVSGSDSPGEGAMIYEWNPQDGDFIPISDLSEEIVPGKGYAVYFFGDNDLNTPGVDGFPKVISSDKAENSSLVSTSIASGKTDSDDTFWGSSGWNLLGNPFGSDIMVDEILASIRTALQIEGSGYKVNANVYIWDPSANGGNGDYIILKEDEGETIAPFQAFWVRLHTNDNEAEFNVNTSLERNKLLASQGNSTFKTDNSNREGFGFRLSLNDGSMYDDYQLVFNRRGSIEPDIYDAYKLFSLNENAISLYSITGEQKLMKNVLPADLETSIEIPLHFEAKNRQSLIFNWDGLENIPDSWEITLLDRRVNKEINLRSVPNYNFEVRITDNRSKRGRDKQEPILNIPQKSNETSRFALMVSPAASGQMESPDIPESVKLNPNYPNPFNPTTTISYELKNDSEVLLTIWNIVGQKVVTLVDGMKEAGEHTATWNASDMPSGLYIAQLEVGGQVYIRKMTLIK